MRTHWAIFFCLLLAAIPLAARGDAENPVNPSGHLRGKKTGTYNLKVVGNYSGLGTSSVTATSISITMTLKAPNGASGSACFNDMPLVNDRFQGSASLNGITLTLSGRLDMPAATDTQQSQAQAITGRVTANLADPAGKGGRLVAIQDAASRATVTSP